jgi:hypothetical protein
MGGVMEVRQTFSVTAVDRPAASCVECGLVLATGDIAHLAVVSEPEGEHYVLIHADCYLKVNA